MVTSRKGSDADLSVRVHICPSQAKGCGLGRGRARKLLAYSVSVIRGGYKNREEFSIKDWLKKTEYITKNGSEEKQVKQTSHFIFISFSVNLFSIV